MAASKKKRTGARAAVVVVLCLVLVCVVAAAVALGLVSRRVKSFAGGASFSLDYQITSTAAEEPALYKVLAQFGGTSGRVDGQYTPEALQLELYPQASGSSQPLTRLYISKDETLYDAGQLYRTLRSSITDNHPLAGVLIPEWNMGSYISQTQLASLLGVDDTATSLQSMNDFQLDLKKIKKVQPENAKEGYLYFRLETDDTAADSPVLTLGVEKSGLLRAASPAVHILLDIPAHGIHTELTGTVTPAAPTLTAPTSRMQDSDIASLVQLRQTIESVVQFVQGAASGTQSASRTSLICKNGRRLAKRLPFFDAFIGPGCGRRWRWSPPATARTCRCFSGRSRRRVPARRSRAPPCAAPSRSGCRCCGRSRSAFRCSPQHPAWGSR